MPKAEINGNLEFMSLATLISDNCNEQRTCRILVQSENNKGEIYLESGNVIHASLDNDIGERAFRRIIHLNQGTFKLFSDEKSPHYTIRKNHNKLLLESAQFIDENIEGIDWNNFSIQETGPRKSISRLEQFIDDLKKVDGILGVTAYYKQSKTFQENSSIDLVKYGSFIIDLIQRAKLVGKLFRAVRLNFILVNNSESIMIINYGLNAIILLVKKTNINKNFMNDIKRLIKKYK
ncbi:DUF4388 domain-containing protein [candidate division KSB1 bacterium]|nr:DUF4388 domain-containing protein [candidate division KSB1 bacterium]